MMSASDGPPSPAAAAGGRAGGSSRAASSSSSPLTGAGGRVIRPALGITIADTLFFTALRRLGPGLLAVVETDDLIQEIPSKTQWAFSLLYSKRSSRLVQ